MVAMKRSTVRVYIDINIAGTGGNVVRVGVNEGSSPPWSSAQVLAILVSRERSCMVLLEVSRPVEYFAPSETKNTVAVFSSLSWDNESGMRGIAVVQD